jgi:hypothetical protein
MKTTKYARELLGIIAHHNGLLHSLYEDNKALLCSPIGDLQQRIKVKGIRQDLAESKKWKESAERMLVLELLAANGHGPRS